jgi:hypothetical protein
MKPENRLDQHVKSGSEIIAAADVAQFMRKDRAQLGGREMLGYAFGQHENGPQNSKNAGLKQCGSG